MYIGTVIFSGVFKISQGTGDEKRDKGTHFAISLPCNAQQVTSPLFVQVTIR